MLADRVVGREIAAHLLKTCAVLVGHYKLQCLGGKE